MKDPFRVLHQLHAALIVAVRDGAKEYTLSVSELLLVKAALDYATNEWWEELKDKE